MTLSDAMNGPVQSEPVLPQAVQTVGKVNVIDPNRPAIDRASPFAPAPKSQTQNSRKLARGARVNIVTADGNAIEGEIVNYSSDNQLVDIEFTFRGALMKITKSPFDPTAKHPDTWHWPDAA